MQLLILRHRFGFIVFSCIFMLTQLSGCTIRVVSHNDTNTAKQIILVYKVVDKFYGELLETKYKNRSYDKLKDKYLTIEVDIRALIIENKARPLNDAIISISETILNKWIKYKEKHKENWVKYLLPEGDSNKIDASNIYKNNSIKTHRKRFNSLFAAMFAAEKRSLAEERRRIATGRVRMEMEDINTINSINNNDTEKEFDPSRDNVYGEDF